jgi:hypothetical protein
MKSIHRTGIVIITALIFAAQAQHENAGTTAFPFLTMNYDARSMAMGGAATAMANDVYGVLSNPAALGYVDRNQIIAGYRQMIMDIWGGPLGIALVTPRGVFTPYLLTHTSGALDEINESGIATGRIARSSYAALGLSWARLFYDNKAAAGATVKGLYHHIGVGAESYSADGFAFDLGVQYRTNNNRLIYGASLRNLGFVRSGYWGEWNEHELPYGVEVGVSYVPDHIRNLRLALDVNKFNGDYVNFEPALEFTILENTLFLRGGYSFSSLDFEKLSSVLSGERDEDYQKSGINTLSLGVGVAGTMDDVDVRLDAAIQFYSDTYIPGVSVSLIVGF